MVMFIMTIIFIIIIINTAPCLYDALVVFEIFYNANLREI